MVRHIKKTICGSAPQGKSETKEFVESKKDIKTILDIGPGSATYPKLFEGRPYTWYAIEIWKPYIERFELNKYYKKVFIGDACKFDYDLIKDVDCVIAGSVFEHFDRDSALKVFKEWDKRFKHIILSVPLSDKYKYESRIHFNNPFEGHKSYWKFKELRDLTKWQKTMESKQIGLFMK